MPTDLIAVRPEISVVAILGYAFIAFLIGLLITPRFVAFLRFNKIGKQLRVEAVDGRDASIFLKFHESKKGTPTMGGILIWSSILITVLVSRALSYFGYIENSILQRGQVYLPLFMLLTLGLLGAIDDYLNVIGGSKDKWNAMLKPMKLVFGIVTIILTVVGLLYFSPTDLINDEIFSPSQMPIAFIVLYIVAITWIGTGIAVLDDVFKKIAKRPSKNPGLAVLPKLTSLILISAIGAVWFYSRLGYDSVIIPFYGEVDIGAAYIPLFMFIIVGTANAVNVTDGLDGLAAGLLMIAFAAFGVLAYINSLFILAAFCAVCVGGTAAFLWHNVPPALFYMGDTGSLALGGTLGVIAMMTETVLILPFIGFIFVMEMLSVIIQLTSKKLRGGKKVFRAAPIHHHFEALEWGESKVTMRFWIIGLFFAFLGVIISIFG